MHGTPHTSRFSATGALRALAALGMIGAGVIAIGIGTAPATAAPGQTIGSFPSWTVSGGRGASTGTATWSTAAQFPATTFVSNTAITVASGSSAFLGQGTGFAGVYGSSRLQPYLTIGASGSSSTTTFTFAGDEPAGWGFALGDVDVDYVTITGTTADGQSLTADDIGWQGGDVDTLNYCRATPKPTTCGAGTAASFTDFPRWDPAGGTTERTSSPTLVGTNSGNTSGAYGWFRPTRTDLRTLTFTYGVQSGIPNYQVWFAALAQAETISGTVAVPGAPAGTLAPPDTTVQLASVPASGDPTPVLDASGAPVTAPVATDGTYSITVEPGTYEVTVVPPAGSAAPDPASTGPIVVTDADVVAPTIGTPPATETAPTGTASAPAGGSGSGSAGGSGGSASAGGSAAAASSDLTQGPGFLAATGSNPTPAVVIAIVIVIAGLVAIEIGRRRRLRDGERRPDPSPEPDPAPQDDDRR